MKEKDENFTNACQKSGIPKSKDFCAFKIGDFESCGCSIRQIWLGIAVIVIIMIAAAIFGN